MIYFLQARRGQPIKIGTTVRLSARLRQLGKARGALKVLGVLDGGRDRERDLHEAFSHLRLGKTERFRPDGELIDFIARECRSWDGEDESPSGEIVRLELSAEHHARLRVIAAEAGQSMAAYARAVVTKAIDEASGKRGPKRNKP